MRRGIFILCLLSLALMCSSNGDGLSREAAEDSASQFTAEELTNRSQWEEFIKTADVVDQYQMSGREAVTNPWVLTLKKDDVTHKAIWKDVEGRLKGYIEGWKYEIAAYLLDKHLELNMVPPTVERRYREDRGSCQLWIDDTITLKERTDKKIPLPSYKRFYWNRATYLQRFWDNLIANEDRHMNQILITKDWRMILIDHSRSFRATKKFVNRLIYTEKHKEGPKLMSELPRPIVEKVKDLDFETIKTVVGEYLTDNEINAILSRRDLILKEIDRLVKKNGEEKVLYDLEK